MILSGKLTPGQRLPPEREMAEEMKVSLAVVHGGITRLTAMGFLRVVPRKGVFVADYIRDGNLNTLEALLTYSESYFQEDLLDALVDFRRACELRVTAIACRQRSAEDLERLESLVEEFLDCRNAEERSQIAFRFHHELAIISGNFVYPLTFSTFRNIYVSCYRTMFLIEGIDFGNDLLTGILQRVREQDATGAERVLAASIDHWYHTFQAYYRSGQRYRGIQR